MASRVVCSQGNDAISTPSGYQSGVFGVSRSKSNLQGQETVLVVWGEAEVEEWLKGALGRKGGTQVMDAEGITGITKRLLEVVQVVSVPKKLARACYRMKLMVSGSMPEDGDLGLHAEGLVEEVIHRHAFHPKRRSKNDWKNVTWC